MTRENSEGIKILRPFTAETCYNGNSFPTIASLDHSYGIAFSNLNQAIDFIHGPFFEDANVSE
jgi:hypothetical protein